MFRRTALIFGVVLLTLAFAVSVTAPATAAGITIIEDAFLGEGSVFGEYTVINEGGPDIGGVYAFGVRNDGVFDTSVATTN